MYKHRGGASTDAVRAAEEIIKYAEARGASDIHLLPGGEKSELRIRVDGVLFRAAFLPAELFSRISSRIKVIASLDITERRRPQDGSARLSDTLDIRVSTLPTVSGESIVIRLLDKRLCSGTLSDLGMSDENLRLCRELLDSKSGLLLIAGPTGSGKSTTMYGIIKELASASLNIVTVEEPVEYTVTGVNQAAVNARAGMTFSSALRAALRQDPDVIGIGEIRDAETSKIAHSAALSGRLVISTVHVGAAASLKDRLAMLGTPWELTASALRGVIVQRLLRRVSPERAGVTGDGCKIGSAPVFSGRTGAFGIVSFPPRGPERFVLADEALAADCKRLAELGVTTEEEVRGALFQI